MAKKAGAALRGGSTFLRLLEFGCAAGILGIFSYFLADLAQNNQTIARRWQAVEGMSGAGVVYTFFGIILTCFLGGNAFFGSLAILLDILFCGAFIAIAVLCRNGASSCSGNVTTPLGVGAYGTVPFGSATLGTACKLNTACFALAIIGAFLFLLTALLQIFIIKNHKKDKRYGPGPDNNYTSGKNKFWARKPKTYTEKEYVEPEPVVYTRDVETPAVVPVAPVPEPTRKHGLRGHNNMPVGTGDGGLVYDHVTANRPSADTGYTTLGGNNNLSSEPKYGQPGYGQATNY